MTEQDWDDGTDPESMLEFLRGKASRRKQRLFACACCRRVWDTLPDEGDRRAVEAAEQHADGLLGEERLVAARLPLAQAALRARRTISAAFFAAGPLGADLAVVVSLAAGARGWAVSRAAEARARARGEPVLAPKAERRRWKSARKGVEAQERARQAALVREVFGNPFRPAAIEAGWRAWHGGAVVRLAGALYEERELPAGHLDLARLAVLADMLEEAGCGDADLLAHLRGPGPHVRGCWVVDLLLAKN